MEWVTEFLAAHPLVRLDFVLSDATADLIADGIDLAVRSSETRNPNHVVRRIHNHAICLLASPAYLAARGTPVELQEWGKQATRVVRGNYRNNARAHPSYYGSYVK